MSERAILLNLPKSRLINIKFENITFTVSKGRKEKRQIIKGVSGEFRSGELTAIMGPSGAGKSSLLNILTGFHRTENVTNLRAIQLIGCLFGVPKQDMKGRPWSYDWMTNNTHVLSPGNHKQLLSDVKFRVSGMGGKVYTNGVERNNKTGAFRKESCYIMQDDQLYSLLSVLETMMMAADLKLGGSLSRKSKLMLVEDILDNLGLTKCKETRCEQLSGGQKKRLSIALELIDNPPVMFLDEPTTGLDSCSSMQCITVLKALARAGRTIICTIHQPSASLYELFDHVYILANGECMYQGSGRNTVQYLLSVGLPCPQYHNPADFISEVVNGEYGDFSHKLALASQDTRWRSLTNTEKSDEVIKECVNSEKTAVLVQPPSELSRLGVLLHRNIIRLHRDWTVTHLKIFLHFAVGLILGLNFTDCGGNGSKTLDNIKFVYCSIIYISYTSMMPAILCVPSEIKIIKKESFNNWYKLRTYFVAFFLTSTPIQLFFCFLYAATAYYLSDQPIDVKRFSMFLAICIVTTLIAEGVGLYLGTLNSILNALFFGSLYTAYLLVYSGVLAIFPQMSPYLYPFSYFSYGRYAFEGLMLSLYGYGRKPLPCPQEAVYCHLRLPEKILAEIGITDGRFWVDFIILLAILLLLRGVAYYALRRKVNIGRC